MKDNELCSFLKKGNKEYLKTTLEMKVNRRKRRTWNKSQRFDNEIQSYFTNSTLPHLAKVLHELQIQKEV